jgi:hypothetical protein
MLRVSYWRYAEDVVSGLSQTGKVRLKADTPYVKDAVCGFGRTGKVRRRK